MSESIATTCTPTRVVSLSSVKLATATAAALRAHRTEQLQERLRAGSGWQDSPADAVGARRSGVVLTCRTDG